MRRLESLLLLVFVVGCGHSELVPSDFDVPTGFQTESFRVRPITVADAEEDYEAVMESIDIIHAALLTDQWPTSSFTLEQNKHDLANKERYFQQRTRFTYTVVSLDESRVLGCVYIYKGEGGPDAAVFMWVRQSAIDTGLDSELESAVRDWIQREWPFERVVYPGRGAPH